MNQWDDLFGVVDAGDSSEPELVSARSAGRSRSKSNELRQLREMVGVSTVVMPGIDVAEQNEALAGLLGDRPSVIRAAAAQHHDSLAQLQGFVAAQAGGRVAARRVRLDSDGESRKGVRRRGTRRWDLVNILAGAVAALALVFTMVLGGAAWAAQSPLTDSLNLLAAQEAKLADSRDDVAQQRLALVNDLNEFESEIAAFESARIGAGDSVDAAASKVLADKTVALSAVLDGVEFVTVPAAYHRTADVSTERGIAEAQNSVAAMQVQVDQAKNALIQQSVFLGDARMQYQADLEVFAKTVPARAAEILTENPDAPADEVALVTANAAAIATEQSTGATGAAALVKYSKSVVTLRASNERVRSEREAAERQAELDSQNDGNSWWPGSGGGGFVPNPPPNPNPVPSPNPTPVPNPNPSPNPSPEPTPDPEPTDPPEESEGIG